MIIKKFNEVNSLPKIAGVYAIVNVLNAHRYIGSTNNFKRRLIRHRCELRGGKHHSIPLQRAYNKYGEDKFEIWILETCDNVKDTILFLEQKYLDLHPEYNISTLANRPSDNCKHAVSEETREKIKKANLGKKASLEARINLSNARKGKGTKPVLQFTMDNVFVKRYNSLVDAAVEVAGNYNVQVAISNCCKGINVSAYGYKWKFENDPRNITESSKPRKNMKVAVVALTKDGQFVKEYASAVDAATELGSRGNSAAIVRTCRGIKRSAFGFKWVYKKDYINYEEL